jgi:hypothetical protein
MSSGALPITAARFSAALTELPLASLYAKRSEIMNSIFHLEKSNRELQVHADQGDVECKEALDENMEVIAKFSQRLELLKTEVENRGYRWDDNVTLSNGQGPMDTVQETENATPAAEHVAVSEGQRHQEQASGTNATSSRAQGGTLNDEELARRLVQQMAEDDGVHL